MMDHVITEDDLMDNVVIENTIASASRYNSVSLSMEVCRQSEHNGPIHIRDQQHPATRILDNVAIIEELHPFRLCKRLLSTPADCAVSRCHAQHTPQGAQYRSALHSRAGIVADGRSGSYYGKRCRHTQPQRLYYREHRQGAGLLAGDDGL